jgi:hypothetical protein
MTDKRNWDISEIQKIVFKAVARQQEVKSMTHCRYRADHKT